MCKAEGFRTREKSEAVNELSLCPEKRYHSPRLQDSVSIVGILSDRHSLRAFGHLGRGEAPRRANLMWRDGLTKSPRQRPVYELLCHVQQN